MALSEDVTKINPIPRCEILGAVLLRIHVFWDITPCQLVVSDI